jgi:hypothetical protein
MSNSAARGSRQAPDAFRSREPVYSGKTIAIRGKPLVNPVAEQFLIVAGIIVQLLRRRVLAVGTADNDRIGYTGRD